MEKRLRRKVLFVDDDKAIREAFAEALTLSGFDVDLAGNGEEALERITRCPYEAVITDLSMPVLDGAGFFLKTIEAVPMMGNRFIFITGNPCASEEKDRYSDLIKGRFLLQKPFGIGDLLEKIHLVMERPGDKLISLKNSSRKRNDKRFIWHEDCFLAKKDPERRIISTSDVSKNGVRIRYIGGPLRPDLKVNIHIKSLKIKGKARVVWSKSLNNTETVSGLHLNEPISSAAMLTIIHGRRSLSFMNE